MVERLLALSASQTPPDAQDRHSSAPLPNVFAPSTEESRAGSALATGEALPEEMDSEAMISEEPASGAAEDVEAQPRLTLEDEDELEDSGGHVQDGDDNRRRDALDDGKPVENASERKKVRQARGDEDEIATQEKEDEAFAMALYREELGHFVDKGVGPAAATTYRAPTASAIPQTKPVERSARATTSLSQQLQEVRQRQADEWKRAGGSGSGKQAAAKGNQGRGLTGSGWKQLTFARRKHKQKWQRQSPSSAPTPTTPGSDSGHRPEASKKRVWTLRDLEASQAVTGEGSGGFGGGGRLRPGGMGGDASAASFVSNEIPSTKGEKVGKACLKLTNEFRAQHGLPPLKWNAALLRIALQHSKEMANNKVGFGHAGFRERRMRMVPYRFSTMAENVAMNHGFRTSNVARVAVDGWIASPGHCKNLLSRSEYCAIGAYRSVFGRWYLTQLFTG